MAIRREEISNEDPEQVFRVLEVIGQGSFGVVCTCTNTKTNEVVAVKFIEITEDDDGSLQKEIDILKSTMDCPFIVKYHGCFLKEFTLMIVMEYCNGGSILDVIQQCNKQLTEPQIAAILKDMLLGLDYLHKNHIMHRDLKAGNVLLNSLGQAKLADFGVSAQMNSTSQKQRTVVGSPYWMSPEVINTQTSEGSGYSNRADVWSLGITGIELADGKPPYFDVSPLRVIFLIPHRAPPTVREPAGWSPEFVDFIGSCLKKNPDDRPTPHQLLQHPFITRVGDSGAGILRELVAECIPLMKEFRAKKALEDAAEEGAANGGTIREGTMIKLNTVTRRATNDSSSGSDGTVVFSSGDPQQTGSVVIH